MNHVHCLKMKKLIVSKLIPKSNQVNSIFIILKKENCHWMGLGKSYNI